MIDHTHTVASGFAPADESAWRALVEKALKGKDFDRVMTREIAPGVSVPSLGMPGEAPSEIPHMRAGVWDICTPHWHTSADAVNKAVLKDLEGGATSVALRMEAGLFPGLQPDALETALAGVFLDLAAVRLMSGENFEASGKALLALGEATGSTAKLTGSLGADPIGALAQNGRLNNTLEQLTRSAAQLAAGVHERAPQLATFVVDTGVYHSAGADAVTELALALSIGVEYLRAMEAAGLEPAIAASQIEFKLAVDAEFFTGIAKLRAMRLLWAAVLAACGAKDAQSAIGAGMALRMLSVRDPYVNVLRATSAGAAAAIGGADFITLVPHDTLYGVPGEASHRLARNIQIILAEESGLARVADPAAGSYQIEAMTTALVDAAWPAFQRREADGGARTALLDGTLAAELAALWQVREKGLRTRRLPLTGVSEFPDLQEELLAHEGPRYQPRTDKTPAAVEIERLPFHRDGEAFEFFRHKSDEIAARDGQRPTALIATLGPLSRYGARLTFVQNLLASIGVDTHVTPADTLPEGGRYMLAVLCGADSDYESDGSAALAGLAKWPTYLAGRWEPLASDGALHGVISMGMDVITLAEALYEGAVK